MIAAPPGTRMPVSGDRDELTGWQSSPRCRICGTAIRFRPIAEPPR
jgi:hypothetical protein